MFYRILFKLTKWLIRKYFSDGLRTIMGTNEKENQIIAWQWAFMDEKYEKERNYINMKFIKEKQRIER